MCGSQTSKGVAVEPAKVRTQGRLEDEDKIAGQWRPVSVLTEWKHVQQALKVWSEGHCFHTALEN